MRLSEKSRELKKELRNKFKGVKFSVRSGSGSINVSWTDFPTVEAVQEIANKYESVRYDEYTGEILCGGNTFVFTNNSWSDEMKKSIKENLIIKYGIKFYNECIENSYDGFRYEKEAYNELYKKSLEVAADTEEKEEPKAEDKKVLYSNEEIQIIEKGNTTRIYFNGKPSEEIRNSIKALGFRFFKNDGFYWGIYTNKTTLEAIKEALQVEDVEEIENTIEDLKQVEQVEEVKNIKEEKTDQILFDIYGEGIREDKEDLTLEELEKEFNARVEDERIYQEQYGKGGYCKTWIIAKYKGIKYKTCRIDLIGNEDLYISLSDTINDVMLGLKNNCSDSLEYYFNSSDFNKCIELIQNLINLLKSKIENKEQTQPKENKFEVLEGITEATEAKEKQNNVQRINNIYSEVEALENRLKLVKSNKLKYKIQDQINSKMKEIAKIILSDELLYLQFMKE